MKLHYSKLNNPSFISFIQSLGHFDINNGPWIAGGSVLASANNMPWNTSDIDIFFKNQEQFEKFNEHMKETHTISGEHKGPNSLTLNTTIGKEYHKDLEKYQVQLINKLFFDSLEKLLDRFDITVCQWATDGTILVTTDLAMSAESQKTINCANNKLTANRLLKYTLKGYSPGLKELIIALEDRHETNRIIYTISKKEQGNSTSEDAYNSF